MSYFESDLKENMFLVNITLSDYIGEKTIDEHTEKILALKKLKANIKTRDMYIILYKTQNLYNWYLIHEMSLNNNNLIEKINDPAILTAKKNRTIIIINNIICIYTKFYLMKNKCIEFQQNDILELYEMTNLLLCSNLALKILNAKSGSLDMLRTIIRNIKCFPYINKEKLKEINDRINTPSPFFSTQGSKKCTLKKDLFKIL